MTESRSHPDSVTHRATDVPGLCACGWRSSGRTALGRASGLKRHVAHSSNIAAADPAQGSRVNIVGLTPPTGSSTSVISAEINVSPEVTVYNDVPFIERMQRASFGFIRFTRRTALPQGMILLITLVWVVLNNLRTERPGWLFAILSFVAVLSVTMIFLLLYVPVRSSWVYGKPIFSVRDVQGEATAKPRRFGLPRRLYRAMLLAADQLKITFKPEATHVAARMSALDAQVTEATMRFLTETAGGTVPRRRIEDGDWATVWQEKFLDGGRVGYRLRFENTIGNLDLSWNLAVVRVRLGQVVVESLGVVLHFVLIVAGVLYLEDRIALVTLVQICIAFTLVYGTILAVVHTFHPAEIHMESGDIPKDVIEEEHSRLEELRALRAPVEEIKAEPGYIEVVRMLSTTSALRDGAWRVLLTGVVAGIGLVVYALWQQSISWSELEWTAELLVVVAVGFGGLGVTLFTTLLAVERAKVVVLALVTALVSATLPTTLTWLATGQAEWSTVSSAIYAIIGGAAATVTTVLLQGRSVPKPS